MSFRDLRCYMETMKSLGYPRPISYDSFRSPNFELVADCLQWLLHRIAPDSTLSDDISTEADRVRFLQSAATITLSKTRARLNLKKLYTADTSSVRELLKLAQLLHRATRTAVAADEEPSEVIDPLVTLKLLDASATTAAARHVVRVGPALHDTLAAEDSGKNARLRALAAAQDSIMVEASIQEALAGLAQGMNTLEQQLSETSNSEAQLTARLEKWTAELERAEKRLSTLAAVRPPYMDEYETLTGKLQVLWLHYLERFRNVQYLEAQLSSYQRSEQDAAAAAERKRKKLQQRLAEEELRILRGEQDAAPSTRASSGRPGTSAAAEDTDSGSSSDSEVASAGRNGNWQGGTARLGQGPHRGFGLAAAGQTGTKAQGGASKVVGSLTAGWDDDDSTGDDNSSAGVLSHGDSQGSGGIARVDAPGGNPVYGESDVSGDGSQSILASDNSGF